MAYPSATTTFTGPENRGLQVGYSSGTVEAHFHPPVERPETPPSPSLFVPFRRDPDFVDRGTILHQLHQKCAAPGSWTALVGLGGVGKSQLAIEHCYRIREQSAETWVFWVHASNAARFEQSYWDIADHLKISGRRNPRVNIFKLVHDWLCDEKKGKWILVLDNVDDASFLLIAQSTGKEDQGNDGDSRNLRPLLAYLPQSQNGSILVTTRTRAAALKLMEESDIIAVLPMEELHALALLEKKLGIQGTSDGTSELVAALEFMPLAIVQAAAYITQRVPRCSVRQYLLEFQKSDREKTSLLYKEAGQLRRDREAKNSIIITWQISFDYICRTKPSAANLLSFMSFFDRQGIPEALVRNRVRLGEYSQHPHRKESRAIRHLRRLFNRNRNSRRDQEGHDRHSKHEDGFEDDLLTLRDYSFVSVAED